MNLSKEKKPILILASSSPRRRAILEGLQVAFILDPSRDFKESSEGSAEEVVLRNAQGKAQEVAARHSSGIVLGVDTIGELEGQIFEKPKNDAHAFEMLKNLQGKTHRVFSGICLIEVETGRMESAVEESRVTFAPLSDAEIHEYLAYGEHSDKAAAYGIQGRAALFVQKIDGDYWNIVGLPLARLRELALHFDLDLLQSKNN